MASNWPTRPDLPLRIEPSDGFASMNTAGAWFFSAIGVIAALVAGGIAGVAVGAIGLAGMIYALRYGSIHAEFTAERVTVRSPMFVRVIDARRVSHIGVSGSPYLVTVRAMDDGFVIIQPGSNTIDTAQQKKNRARLLERLRGLYPSESVEISETVGGSRPGWVKSSPDVSRHFVSFAVRERIVLIVGSLLLAARAL